MQWFDQTYVPSYDHLFEGPTPDYQRKFKYNNLRRSLYYLGSTASYLGAAAMRTRSGKRLRGYKKPTRNVRQRYSQSRSMRRRMPVEGRGVTNQHDRQMIYRKKSMPRYKKKSWKRFKSKVNAVAEKGLGSQTVVFNGTIENSYTSAAEQGVMSLMTYSLSSVGIHYRDLQRIASYVNDSGDYTNSLGVIVKPSTKYFFQSCILDITMRNISYQNVTAEPDTSCSLEVDLYEITVSKSGSDSTTAYNMLEDYFARGAVNTPEIGATTIVNTNSITLNLRGVTPWDLPAALSEFGIKIWKKTKFFLGYGQTSTYQYRDPKRRVFVHDNLLHGESCNVRGASRHILIVYKAVPGVTVGSVSGTTRPRLHIGSTRKYLYKVEGNNEDRDVHVAL